MIDKHFWQDKRVLVTGHTGFKGSWLSIWLSSLGAKVHGISLPPNSGNCLFTQARVESIITSNNFCDICNLNKLKSIVIDVNPEIVFHLAAQPLVIKSYHNSICHGTGRKLDRPNSISKFTNKGSINKITKGKVKLYYKMKKISGEHPDSFKNLKEVINSLEKKIKIKKLFLTKPIYIFKS